MASSVPTPNNPPKGLTSLSPRLLQRIADYLNQEYAALWILDAYYKVPPASSFRADTSYVKLALTNHHLYESVTLALHGPLDPEVVGVLEEEILNEKNGRIQRWAERYGLFGGETSYTWWDGRLEVGRW